MTDLRHTLENALSGTHTIEQELSGGGMSRVFVAQDRALDRKVVVKVLSPDLAAEVNTERFRREIQLAARLQHPHIVPLISSGEMGGLPYFTMPFLEGESLRARLAHSGELPIHDAVRYLRQIASALAHAHKHGIVHRDIKPDNVMLVEDFAEVLDFGVAKALASSTMSGTPGLTTHGVALGTPAYMSPEQAAGDPGVDHRTDIYAFGILAYEALTGSHPFAGRPTQAMMAAHAVERVEPIGQRRAGIPADLAAIVMRCVEKRPSDRFQSATDLAHALENVSFTTASAAAPGGSAGRAWRYAVAAAVLLAIGVGGYLLSQRNTVAERRATAPMLEVKSIAVMPLTNVGGDSKDDYFTDGMTDELANALSKLPGVRVASRSSSYALRSQKSLTPADIGEKLNVQALLEGTVSRSGDRLRVIAQLTNVADGLTLWSERYEREMKDVFAVQDDIARSVAQALQVKLAGGATPAHDARGTENLAAYDLYLRGRYFWNQRGDRNIRAAITHFDDALGEDPRFARAHAARGIAYVLLREYTDSLRPGERREGAASANRALELDPTLAEAHTALGLDAVHRLDYEEAERRYRRSISLDPYYATAHQWLGEIFYSTGRLDSALAYMRKASALDPLAPIIPSALGYTEMLNGNLDAALATIDRGIQLAPQLGHHHATKAKIHLVRNEHELALKSAELAHRLDPIAVRKALLVYVLARNGRTEEARKLLGELRRQVEAGSSSRVHLAAGFVGMGEKDSAFIQLERAIPEEDRLINGTFLVEPLWRPIRSDPRFTTLLEKVGVAKYAANLSR